MNLDKNELKLLAAAQALEKAAPDQPVRTADLVGVFDRPGALKRTLDKLRIGGFIVFDPHQSVFRVLPDRVWQALNQFGVTPELFTQERPLDAALAKVSQEALKLHVSGSRFQVSGEKPSALLQDAATPREREIAQERVILHGENNQVQGSRYAPAPPKPPDPPPPKPPVNTAVHAPHALHAMPMKPCPATPFSQRLRAACSSCNPLEEEKLHEKHEVGELAPRTTGQILDELLRYVPGMTDEHLYNWYERVVREDADLVNGALRELKLQRRHIRNPGGFLNAIYLRGIKARSTERHV